MAKKVLLLTYYFPPCAFGFSIRALNFAKYLPENGYEPVVLTVQEDYYKDYSARDNSQTEGITGGLTIHRTPSLEPKTKLKPGLVSGNAANKPNLKHKLLHWVERNLMIPDVQILWLPYALRQGIRLLKGDDIPVILAVGPPFSAFIAAYLLKVITGRKLVLDFKDMWIGREHHEDKSWANKHLSRWWEKRVVKAADWVILNTDYSLAQFQRRYPGYAHKFSVIPNGYDPKIEKLIADIQPERDRRNIFHVAHTGTIDTDRNPGAFIQAVAELTRQHPGLPQCLKVTFIGKVHPEYHQLVSVLGLDRIFEFKGYLSYDDNIRLLAQADLLLLLPTHDSPDAIPGKVYEYFALRKPILALAEDGAAKTLLASLKAATIEDPKDKDAIKQTFWQLYQQFVQGKLSPPQIPLERFNRRNQTQQLAEVIDNIHVDKQVIFK